MMDGAWAEAARYDLPLAFMMIDLDDFKAVNDSQGHQRGDEILREAGRIIRSNCRQVDIPARYGGDEFCVLMPESEAAEVVQVARRVLRQWELANKAKAAGEPRLGMSIGVAQIDASDPKSSEELIHHADEALYAAKAAGKGRIMRRDLNGIRAVSTSADGEMPPSEVVLIDRHEGK
jgi:diguanylate cyclase (GGDEF)-like protein